MIIWLAFLFNTLVPHRIFVPDGSLMHGQHWHYCRCKSGRDSSRRIMCLNITSTKKYSFYVGFSRIVILIPLTALTLSAFLITALSVSAATYVLFNSWMESLVWAFVDFNRAFGSWGARINSEQKLTQIINYALPIINSQIQNLWPTFILNF